MEGERPAGDLDDLDVVAARMGMSYDEDAPSSVGDPDRNLLIGWVARAVSDYIRYRNSLIPKHRLTWRRAQYWLFSETRTNGSGPEKGSFAWVCEWLGEDPNACRSRIENMTIDQLPKVDHYSRERKRKRSV